MRKIVSFHVVTVDGYYEGPNGEFDWPVVDEEFKRFAGDQLTQADTLMFGRVTYEVMASYWPTPAAQQDDPVIAPMMNTLPKIVVSATMDKGEWADTTVVSDLSDLADVKHGPGGEIIIMGSSNLVVNLIAAGLIDEVRIMVHPVVLGAGRSLFHTASTRINLRSLAMRSFRSGNVLHTYLPPLA